MSDIWSQIADAGEDAVGVLENPVGAVQAIAKADASAISSLTQDPFAFFNSTTKTAFGGFMLAIFLLITGVAMLAFSFGDDLADAAQKIAEKLGPTVAE